jgi:flavin reductase (DIM6/NTAB) family NADH-FMN oxidoreductase RutF
MDNTNDAPSNLDARDFRNALGCYPTGVIIMTGLAESGERIGLTINSFTSVSLDPPLVSVCLARTASSFETLQMSQGFVFNVLRDDQRHISGVFAKSGNDKWRGVKYRDGINGVPILVPNLAAFQCSTYAEHDAGDHIIVIGRVVAVEFDTETAPLVFHQGGYSRLLPKDAADKGA